MFPTRYQSHVLRATRRRRASLHRPIVRAFREPVPVRLAGDTSTLRSMALVNRPSPREPHTANYSAAIARAVEWLGDRYLLAKPIKAVADRAAGVSHIAAASEPNSQRPAARRM